MNLSYVDVIIEGLFVAQFAVADVLEIGKKLFFRRFFLSLSCRAEAL